MTAPGDRPVAGAGWVRPGTRAPAEPRWGHEHGLQIGLAPLPGPRGLIRVFAPYLGHAPERVVNFVAIEPVPSGATERGFSELEWSDLDDERGKRFWSLDDPSASAPGDPSALAGGVLDEVGGVGRLTVYIGSERFANGADVYVRARFLASRPYEVALAAFRRQTSVPLDRLILTATMGNYARLRHLGLADGVVAAGQLWPDFGGDGFTAHARFGLAELCRVDGAAVVTAAPDEPVPEAATYADGTRAHWRYTGRRAVQGWRCDDPRPGLEVLVNGRACYWASTSPIPGGVAFENVELGEPFRQGQEYVFSVVPLE